MGTSPPISRFLRATHTSPAMGSHEPSACCCYQIAYEETMLHLVEETRNSHDHECKYIIKKELRDRQEIGPKKELYESVYESAEYAGRGAVEPGRKHGKKHAAESDRSTIGKLKHLGSYWSLLQGLCTCCRRSAFWQLIPRCDQIL